MSIIAIGIDLAKNILADIFWVHGVNESGRAELDKPKVARATFFRVRPTG